MSEPLTKQELEELLEELEVHGFRLASHQARYIASTLWNRIQIHRNRAYQLGYLHGRNNHNSICEEGMALYAKPEDVPTLFDVEAGAA